jgi:hypothetical protein
VTNGDAGQFSVAILRDSDNAVRSFTPAEVADGTANTWVQAGVGGAANGFVRRGYDQSVTALDVSNLNHADQSDPTKMPKLFDSSTGLILENGKAAIDFTSSYTCLLRSFTALPQPNHFFYILNPKLQPEVFITSVDYSQRNQIGSDTNTTHAIYAGAPKGAPTTNTNRNLYSTLFDGSASKIYENETLILEADPGSQSLGGLTLGGFPTFSYSNFTGVMQIVVIYPSDQSANRDAIETAINNEYSIYP